jgi:hypothetical protein
MCFIHEVLTPGILALAWSRMRTKYITMIICANASAADRPMGPRASPLHSLGGAYRGASDVRTLVGQDSADTFETFHN